MLHHPVLLGGPKEIAEVAAAVHKVQQFAEEIAALQ
jgi:hypothetical protein